MLKGGAKNGAAGTGQTRRQDNIGKALRMGNTAEFYIVMECGEQVGAQVSGCQENPFCGYLDIWRNRIQNSKIGSGSQPAQGQAGYQPPQLLPNSL